MIRGTTPRHTFTLPFPAEHVKKVRIIYAQSGQAVLTKEVDTVDGDSITVSLTQEDTLRFDAAHLVEIQLRVLMDDGQALSSAIIKCSVGRCLEEEVLV